jgi:hypothetical protein
MKRDPNTTSVAPERMGATSPASCSRIELEVRVLDGQNRAGRPAHTKADGCALPLIVLVPEHAQRWQSLFKARQQLAGSVGRPVVDHDDLAVDRKLDVLQAVQNRRHRRDLVVNGDDDRQKCASIPFDGVEASGHSILYAAARVPASRRLRSWG